MANYPNTLGLAVSNGSILRDDHMNAAAVVKAVVRDLKEYMRLKNGSTGQRILPLCYSAANSDTRDIKILDYLLSGDGPSSIDFWTVSASPQQINIKVSNAGIVQKSYMDRAHKRRTI